MHQIFVQIWDISCNGQARMTRSCLYKALALIALAQQGKTISDRLLEAYGHEGEFKIVVMSFCLHS